MVSLSTPSFAHLKEKDFENVYEPAEDTFLMMDALEKDYKTILESKPLICVEIGPGSGVLITFLASIVQDAYYIASDINDLSSYATLQTGQENHVNINTITDNLMSSLTPRLAKKKLTCCFLIHLMLLHPLGRLVERSCLQHGLVE